MRIGEKTHRILDSVLICIPHNVVERVRVTVTVAVTVTVIINRSPS